VEGNDECSGRSPLIWTVCITAGFLDVHRTRARTLAIRRAGPQTRRTLERTLGNGPRVCTVVAFPFRRRFRRVHGTLSRTRTIRRARPRTQRPGERTLNICKPVTLRWRVRLFEVHRDLARATRQAPIVYERTRSRSDVTAVKFCLHAISDQMKSVIDREQ